MAKAVIGLFKYQDDAGKAVDKFKNLGYDAKDISVIMKDVRDTGSVGKGTTEHVVAGAGSGALTGGVFGALTGLLIGIGAITIPGIGALLIGGPIAVALGLTGAAVTATSGAITGALAGGLVGGLVGLGVPEEEAKIYEEEIRGGGVLLIVPARDERVEEVQRILEEYRARSMRQIDLPKNAAHLTDD